MASATSRSGGTRPQRTQTLARESEAETENATGTGNAASAAAPDDEDKVLPLPNWLRRLYFIFPIVLYVPDAIFNFYVYSDGVQPPNASVVMQVAFFALWGFVSAGVVGMAYLLSVLAPWHWGQRHRVQAFFCGLGVLIATAITTWNSLAYRSLNFKEFNTDQWLYSLWPQLKSAHFSVTMVLVAVAPPFWGLFWAIVQPTDGRRHNIAQLQESHAERLVRIQQEAELKQIRAAANAKIREAQLAGLAKTAAAARAQAAGLVAQGRKGETSEVPAVTAAPTPQVAITEERAKDEQPAQADQQEGASKLVPFHSLAPSRENPSRPVFMNSVAPSSAPEVYAAPARQQRPAFAAQPAMFGGDVQGSMGMPASDVLRPPTLGGFDDEGDLDESTGTSGVHRALRRPNQVSPLMSSLSGLHPTLTSAIDDLVRELSPEYAAKGGKIPQGRMISGLMEKLNITEDEAKKSLARYKEQRGVQRSGNTPRRPR